MRWSVMNSQDGDDLESVSYVVVYLIKGELPWQDVKGKTKEERYAKILENEKKNE